MIIDTILKEYFDIFPLSYLLLINAIFIVTIILIRIYKFIKIK